VNLSGLSRIFTEKLEKMTPKQLIGIAAAVSLFIAVIIYFYLVGASQDDMKQVKQNLMTVVVASEDIPQRAVIREGMLKTVEMSSDIVPAGSVTDKSSIVGKVAKTLIMQGDAITDRKLFNDGKMAGFVGAIPADCRAISIGVTDITGVSGFAKPGDYVDVILVSDKKQKNTVSSEMILQNILLLAVNKNDGDASTDIAANDKDKKSAAASSAAMTTVTLAVRPEDTMKLSAAQAQGTIYLVLRPFKPSSTFILDTDFSVKQVGGETSPTGQSSPNAAPQSFAQPQQNSTVAQPFAQSQQNSTVAPEVPTNFGVEVIRGTSSGGVK
jgi:pilus assembly protein CpaB